MEGKEVGSEVHDKACPGEEHALRYRWRSERMIRVDRIGDYRARQRNVRGTCIVVERPLNGAPEVQSYWFIPFSRDRPPDIHASTRNGRILPIKATRKKPVTSSIA